MVMEQQQQQPQQPQQPAVLSPQCVGREFVRQYYTLLNEAPAHLHRFYNNSSSFIHGEPDGSNKDTNTVVGQRQIHQRIQELNFRDCHAKITQVDSQATLGNGVVVQVTGELSNNGQPMRRFTQTFVLASQNPKKYYVHNDIFRYQDLLTDEEEGDMARSDLAEEDQEQDVRQNEIRQNETIQPENNYYTPTVNGTAEPKIEDVNNLAPTEHITQHSQQMNSANFNSLDMIQQPTSQLGQDNGAVIVQNSNYSNIIKDEDLSEPQEPQKLQQVYHTAQVPPPQAPIVPQPAQTLGSSEPKTYATLVKTGTNMPMYYSGLPSAPSAPPVQPIVNQPSTPTALSPTPPVETKPAEIRQNSAPKPQRNEVGRSNYSPRVSTNSDDNGNFGGSGDAERRRTAQYTEKSSMYPDQNQLFIGNVPVQASEPELRNLFGKFGTIVDLRILSKPASKSPVRVPNYGFVIFEDHSSVQAVLQSKPIMFPDENGVKLNVEEKKAKRGGGGEGGRPPRGGGGGMIRGPMGGSSRGPPEPRGPSRGGMRGGGFNGNPTRRN